MAGSSEAKAIENNFFVGKERRLGDQNRLETDVVQAVNDAFQRTFLQGCLSFVTLRLICFFKLIDPCVFFFSEERWTLIFFSPSLFVNLNSNQSLY